MPEEFIVAVFTTMELAHWPTFQILTKRPEQMAVFTQQRHADKAPPKNIWLGTCTEDQVAYDERRPHLLATKAAGRGLSVEPLLGPINFGSMDGLDWIVVGGEPGPGARPVAKEWATGIRNDSQQAGVPFFFKQWGAFNAVARKLARKSSPSLWTAWSTLRSRKSNRGSKIMKNQNNPGIETVPVSTGIEPAIPRVKAR